MPLQTIPADEVNLHMAYFLQDHIRLVFRPAVITLQRKKSMKVVLLNAATLPIYQYELASLLIGAIEQGAPMGFEQPLSSQMAENFFHDLRPQINSQLLMLWIARDSHGVVGTVQLKMDNAADQTLSGSVTTLLVHPKARRSGIARKMMRELEETALGLRCDMLSSDLRSGTGAESFYRAQGYRCRSSVVQNSRSDVVYYKPLR
jgi:ribosomal protein S18 acetylase RimI-like enzyme